MEKYFISNSITVFYVTAASFPAGIKAAHQQLHQLLPGVEGRNFFGISYPVKPGTIIYKAAVEEAYDGEAAQLHAPTFIIPKGSYISTTLLHWQKDESIVAKTFQQLLTAPNIDEHGFCLELYPNATDMICLVKLNDHDRSV